MKNNGLFSALFIEDLKDDIRLDDAAEGRMATLAQTWRTHDGQSADSLWNTFLKKAVGYLEFVPPGNPAAPGVFPLFEDWGYSNCVTVLYLVEPGANIDDTSVGRYYPAKLIAQLRKRKLNWGILTNGAVWRLYSTKSSRPYEDFVELPLMEALAGNDQAEYGLFERFFHRDSFVPDVEDEEDKQDQASGVYKCRLDKDRDQSEAVLEQLVKAPFLYQVDEVLQYICNGFILDTKKTGEEYTEEERAQIFQSAVKLIYRCLFLFYAEARRLLPSDPEKVELYKKHSMRALCLEAQKFRWGERSDNEQYDLWKHLKGLISAVNDGDPEYGIMGYDGGLFDDEEEKFLGQHQLRNDFISRALYLLAYVEPQDNNQEDEYEIPYEDLEVRHLGELYENILEYTVLLADADRIRRRTKKGVEILLASSAKKQSGDIFIRKGDVFFGESALERKQTGSYYTPESLVRFLNEKTIIQPLRETFEKKYRKRFEEFLNQAINGHDIGSRRGAAQSAAALVERFTENDVLTFRVCDPAMGSGHFLVDAANQMAGLVVALLEEVPYVEAVSVSASSNPNDWRRRITRHCLYGVDLNPLAVNLAKLSLWLNCFAGQHRLTFLDHHLRCGNSLIGIRSLKQLAVIPERKKDGKKKNGPDDFLFDFSDLSVLLAEAAGKVSSIASIDEDDTDSQKSVLQISRDSVANLYPLADLFTAYLMDSGFSHSDYQELFEHLIKQQSINPTLFERIKIVKSYRDWHRFFHWPLEFPDVFSEDVQGGFSATIGNPPWDTVRSNSHEFFSIYDRFFRSYKKQEANRKASEIMSSNKDIARKWEEYRTGIEKQVTYYKEPINFKDSGQVPPNTYRLFLEQYYLILQKNGRIGIVVPSGLYTDQACLPLRDIIFRHCNVNFIYCFENKLGIFNIHRMFKFVLLSATKGNKTSTFKCAFMEQDPNRLHLIDNNAFRISIEQIERFSPNTLSLMEFAEMRELTISSRIYSNNLILGNYLKSTWNTAFQDEFHMTHDSKLFHFDCCDQNDKLVPLCEGKQIWILTNSLSSPTKWMTKKNASNKPTTKFNRAIYRSIASNTNERTLIPSVVPAGTPTGNSLDVCPLPTKFAVLIATIMGTFVVDWITRKKVTTNLSKFITSQLPMINPENNCQIHELLLALGCRLICTTQEFIYIWKDCFSDYWINSEFWYNSKVDLNSYGPSHEHEIRYRLKEETLTLTPDWEPHCGIHERLPDRRDTGDRAQLRAEIDAYIAYLYGLSRDDFIYILDTFPVLKKKEETAFGEFMSKRKCLEEYDRISLILGSNG